MKAIVQHVYGPPHVLTLEEIDPPTARGNEVLVRVRAASVQPGDHLVMTGVPYFLRLIFGLRRPRTSVPGRDVAGQVEAVGGKVRRLRPGDKVFGWGSTGALAEYASAREDHFALKPANLTMEQAGKRNCDARRQLGGGGQRQAEFDEALIGGRFSCHGVP